MAEKADENARLSVTVKYKDVKGKGYDMPWVVFHGTVDTIRRDIVQFFGFEDVEVKNEDVNDANLPLYIAEIDGARKYIIPMTGNGLWGGIWGYIALNDDCNTIYGVYFNHESETAGLGAEIKDNEKWQQQFAGKKIFKAGTTDIGLSVVKKVDDPATQCDGVTGATLTMDGVTLMFADCLEKYKPFLTNNDKEE